MDFAGDSSHCKYIRQGNRNVRERFYPQISQIRQINKELRILICVIRGCYKDFEVALIHSVIEKSLTA
jgi:hypothetical protein